MELIGLCSVGLVVSVGEEGVAEGGVGDGGVGDGGVTTTFYGVKSEQRSSKIAYL